MSEGYWHCGWFNLSSYWRPVTMNWSFAWLFNAQSSAAPTGGRGWNRLCSGSDGMFPACFKLQTCIMSPEWMTGWHRWFSLWSWLHAKKRFALNRNLKCFNHIDFPSNFITKFQCKVSYLMQFVSVTLKSMNIKNNNKLLRNICFSSVYLSVIHKSNELAS